MPPPLPPQFELKQNKKDRVWYFKVLFAHAAENGRLYYYHFPPSASATASTGTSSYLAITLWVEAMGLMADYGVRRTSLWGISYLPPAKAPEIWLEITPPGQPRPILLPPKVGNLLGGILDMETSLMQLTWQVHADLAETIKNSCRAGVETVVPPTSVCLQPGCNSAPLREEMVAEARLFTLCRGVLPIFSKSLYCRYTDLISFFPACHTRYYNNYFVKDTSKGDAEQQYYSPQTPTLIHVLESAYIEPTLCKYFAMEMLVSQFKWYLRGDFQGYNMSLGESDLPNASRLSSELTGPLVLDAFFLHAILQDKQNR
ncbi:hypothetical protein B0H17DRAFT_1131459 [Mycena rosella]|uniref:CxC5 like cysteine cluster associated with KDZ domain-containing protein n=1 Tax=Mycena rosella TaxID=1033263 RepID=A0AAD7DMN9_MYCRO|nr:hypothetical protein B0H17DRAFT_1131459 [Mycena rosella]